MQKRLRGFLDPVTIIGTVIIIVKIMLINVLIIGLAGIMEDVMMESMPEKLVDLPVFDFTFYDFGYRGNQLYETYTQLSNVIIILFVMAIMVSVVMHLTKQASKFWMEIAKKSFFYILIILSFPFLWDKATEVMSVGAQITMNPVYSFDPDNPCPPDWTDQQILDHYNNNPYKKGFLPEFSVSTAEDACLPEWKLRYIISQMTGIQEFEIATTDPLEWFMEMLSGIATNFFSAVFLSTMKAIVTIHIALIGFLVALMSDLLTGMIIVAMPILLFLNLIPGMSKIVNELLDALPALYLVPLMSGIIVSVGAAVVQSAGSSPIAGDNIGPISTTVIYVWIVSLSTLFMAVTIPLLMVPLLRKVVDPAKNIVSSSITTATFVASSSMMKLGGGVQQMMKNRSIGGSEDSDDGEDSGDGEDSEGEKD